MRQPNRRYPTGQRNHLLLRLMLDTGLRLSEAVNIRWEDIDLNTAKLTVRQGKGAKDPACGMAVDEKKAAATSEYKKTTYYFLCDGV